MSMIKDTTATGPPSTSSRSSCFLGCFGYSGENNMQLIDEVNSSSRRRRWIPKWSFSCKKYTVKTVHVDLSPIHRKSKSVNDAALAKSDTKWEIQVVEEDATLTKKLTKKHVIMVDANHTPVTSEKQKTSRKKWADIVRRENGSFRSRRKETKPAATSATGAVLESPGKKTVPIAHNYVSSPLKPLTHSKSLPQKLPKPPTVGGGVDEGVLHKTTPSGGEFDSIIAMSVLLAILVIMVLWGKLCAIFFTCAWFLVAPRLVAAGKHSAEATAERRPPESQNKLNLESVEYKKKVVLEGLLQRNHRNVAGRL